MSAYVFDQAWEAERTRLAGLELGLDQGTIRHLGARSEYGRHLLDDVCAQGLVDVDAFGRVLMMRGGPPLCTHLRLSIAKVRATLVGTGAATTDEVEETLARLDDPAFATMSAITMAVWGRRPT